MGTHPIFESDFDCLTDSMRLPESQTSNGSNHNNNGMVNGNGKSPKAKLQQLPIHGVRAELVRELRDNDTLIVMGETGSGKTTQLPQFIQDARLINGQIAITQPRRVAAITVAKRVADERQQHLGDEVGYCVRFDEKLSDKTRLKFLTDGMLLREAQRDPSLKRYGCIILDEAHERTIQTDILFGIVKKAQRVRLLKAGMGRLKVIVMSATMDVDHFSKYFNCRVLYLEGRTHPVSVYYSQSNFDDYIGATLSCVLDLHRNVQNTAESILVFLTGRDEIEACLKALRDQLSLPNQSMAKMEVLPLYASLSPQQQIRVFEPAKPGRRRVILATNVAETSITIPGIKHVVDPGRVKQKQYQPGSGMELLKITTCSKAQAWQRAGRAGRESAGSVYRLYTEQHFGAMALATQPEIERSPLATVTMQLLAAGIKNISKFEFLDAPPPEAIKRALEELVLLGVAVPLEQHGEFDLTELGRKVARFPLEPRLTKALLIAAELKCAEEAIIIAALLSTDNIFVFPANRREEAKVIHQAFHASEGDLTTMLNVYKAFNRIPKQTQKNWCHEHYVNGRHLANVADIRKQLREIFTSLNLPLASSGGDMRPIRQAFARGMFMNCAELKPDGHYEELGHKQTVKIHPSSVLFGSKPQFIIFNELIETNSLYIRSVITAEPEWVIREAPGWFRSRLALSD